MSFMRDLFERFQELQANIRALGTITQDEDTEPSIDQLEEFADSVDSNLIELSNLKSQVIEHFIT